MLRQLVSPMGVTAMKAIYWLDYMQVSNDSDPVRISSGMIAEQKPHGAMVTPFGGGTPRYTGIVYKSYEDAREAAVAYLNQRIRQLQSCRAGL